MENKETIEFRHDTDTSPDVEDLLRIQKKFLARLRKKYDLTEPEQLVCAVMRTYSKSWQVAKKIFRSERTIENHRTDIRKKLGLKKNQKLPKFLRSF